MLIDDKQLFSCTKNNLHENSVEVEFNKEKYVIVPFSSILLLFRDKGLLG